VFSFCISNWSYLTSPLTLLRPWLLHSELIYSFDTWLLHPVSLLPCSVAQGPIGHTALPRSWLSVVCFPVSTITRLHLSSQLGSGVLFTLSTWSRQHTPGLKLAKVTSGYWPFNAWEGVLCRTLLPRSVLGNLHFDGKRGTSPPPIFRLFTHHIVGFANQSALPFFFLEFQ